MNLIQFSKEDPRTEYTKPEGKSQTWLADIDVHFTIDSDEESHIEHHEANGSLEYVYQILDDLESYDWSSHIENPDPNTVYVVRGEWYGRWYEVSTPDYGTEWDCDLWTEKDSVVDSYPYDVDSDGYPKIKQPA